MTEDAKDGVLGVEVEASEVVTKVRAKEII